MSEIRFSYNPFTKDFIESSCSHSVAIYNKGKQKQFDEYIRGIIVKKKLYLRMYYPFNDLGELSLIKLKQHSLSLSNQYLPKLLKALESNLKIVPTDIRYNVENDLLKGIGLANI